MAVKVALLRPHPVQLILAAVVVAQVAMVDKALAAQAAQGWSYFVQQPPQQPQVVPQSQQTVGIMFIHSQHQDQLRF